MANDNLLSALLNKKNGKTISFVDIEKNNSLISVISKLKEPMIRRSTFDTQGNLSLDATNLSEFREMSSVMSNDILDIETYTNLLPEIRLAKEIFTAAVIAPKDMTTMEVTHKIDLSALPPNVIASITSEIKDFFEKDLSFNAEIPDIITDCLFETGAKVIAVIPENSLDDFIHGDPDKISLESVFGKEDNLPSMGYLGSGIKDPIIDKRSSQRATLEQYRGNVNGGHKVKRSLSLSIEDFDLNTDTINRTKLTFADISFSDNFNILKMPDIISSHREYQQHKLITKSILDTYNNNISKEAYDFPNQSKTNFSDKEIINKFYSKTRGGFNQIRTFKTQEQLKRKSIAGPLKKVFPTESVIPLYIPGDPKTHMGYFIICDMEGYPITKDKNINYNSEISRHISAGQNTTASNQNTAKVNSLVNGREEGIRQTSSRMIQTFTDLIEKDMLTRLKNGIVGDNVKISRQEEIYTIMLARAISNQQTQLVYVPKEMITYFAFDYNDNGTGRSLLVDQKIIYSLRTMLLYADTMASIKNSVGETNVEMKLDEDDPDPRSTIEMGISEIMKSRQSFFPVGMANPAGQISYLQRAGIKFSFTGHPGLPDVNNTVSQGNTSYPKTDSELNERLYKNTLMGLYVTPDLIDAAHNMEFATSVVASNLFLTKRAIKCQDVFTPQFSTYMRTRMYYDKVFVKKVYDLINSSRKSFLKRTKQLQTLFNNPKLDINNDKIWENTVIELVNMVIDSYSMHLPRPNSATLKAQMETLGVYESAIDKAIEFNFGDFLNDGNVGPLLKQDIDNLKASVKAYYMRDYQLKNGILPEIGDLAQTNDDGTPKLDVYSSMADHVKKLSLSLLNFINKSGSMIRVNEHVMEMINENKGKSSDSSSTDSSSTTDTSTPTGDNSEGDDSGGGGDDMDFGGGSEDIFASMGEQEDNLNGETTPAEGESNPEETPPATPEAKSEEAPATEPKKEETPKEEAKPEAKEEPKKEEVKEEKPKEEPKKEEPKKEDKK